MPLTSFLITAFLLWMIFVWRQKGGFRGSPPPVTSTTPPAWVPRPGAPPVLPPVGGQDWPHGQGGLSGGYGDPEVILAGQTGGLIG